MARVILVTRRWGGAGIDPALFGFRWFLPSIWRYRVPLAHVLVASLFVQLFALVTPLFFQIVIDKVLVHKGLSTLDRCRDRARGDRRCSTSRCNICAPTRLSHTTSRIDVELGSRLFDHLLRLPLAYFETRAARPDGGARARARDHPQLPHRAGPVLGDRFAVHGRLHRRDVPLFDRR